MKESTRKVISFVLAFTFIFQQASFAQGLVELNLASHFASLSQSPGMEKFRPAHLRYLAYDTQSGNFRLFLEQGDARLAGDAVKDSAATLMEYFLVGVTLPNDTFWVNLRPDAADNVIDSALARTEVGRILLEADVQLKKDTASLTNPETPQGKLYWQELYKKADELLGAQNATIPTLVRPWIVPAEIIIRESADNAYIYKATLKVMLEDDYLQGAGNRVQGSANYTFKDPRMKALNEYSAELLRKHIIPLLTKQVNSSKKYAALRQVYYSLILSQWFKQKFYGKGGLYSWLIDQSNLNGLISTTQWSKDSYFKQYQESFKNGEYNVQEPVRTPMGQSMRSYVSGGIDFTVGSSPVAAQRHVLKGNIPFAEIARQSNKPLVGIDVTAGSVDQPAAVTVSVAASPIVAEPMTRRNFLGAAGTAAVAPAINAQSKVAALKELVIKDNNIPALVELQRRANYPSALSELEEAINALREIRRSNAVRQSLRESAQRALQDLNPQLLLDACRRISKESTYIALPAVFRQLRTLAVEEGNPYALQGFGRLAEEAHPLAFQVLRGIKNDAEIGGSIRQYAQRALNAVIPHVLIAACRARVNMTTAEQKVQYQFRELRQLVIEDANVYALQGLEILTTAGHRAALDLLRQIRDDNTLNVSPVIREATRRFLESMAPRERGALGGEAAVGTAAVAASLSAESTPSRVEGLRTGGERSRTTSSPVKVNITREEWATDMEDYGIRLSNVDRDDLRKLVTDHIVKKIEMLEQAWGPGYFAYSKVRTESLTSIGTVAGRNVSCAVTVAYGVIKASVEMDGYRHSYRQDDFYPIVTFEMKDTTGTVHPAASSPVFSENALTVIGYLFKKEGDRHTAKVTFPVLLSVISQATGLSEEKIRGALAEIKLNQRILFPVEEADADLGHLLPDTIYVAIEAQRGPHQGQIIVTTAHEDQNELDKWVFDEGIGISSPIPEGRASSPIAVTINDIPLQTPVVEGSLEKTLESLALVPKAILTLVEGVVPVLVNGAAPVGDELDQNDKVRINYRSPLIYLRRSDHSRGQHYYRDNYPVSPEEVLAVGLVAGMMGVTTNLSIFTRQVKSGVFDAMILRALRAGYTTASQVYDSATMPAFAAMAQRIQQLTTVYGEVRGTASYEVPPQYIHAPVSTALYQARITELGPKVVMVKTPSTAAGLEAIRRNARSDNVIRDNLTLMFGFGQWFDSQDAQLDKLEARVEAGLPIDDYFGVDSFFLSRTDIFIYNIYQALKKANALSIEDDAFFQKILDLVAVAQAKIVGRWNNYIYFGKELPEGTPHPAKIDELRSRFVRIQRQALEKGLGEIRPRTPLWASTMVKGPDVQRGVDALLYFVNLIGPDSVNTMPDGLVTAIELRFMGMTDAEKEAAIRALDNAIDDDRIITSYDPRGENSYSSLTPAKIIEIADALLGKYTEAVLAITGTSPRSDEKTIDIRTEVQKYDQRLRDMVQSTVLPQGLYEQERLVLDADFRLNLDLLAKILTWRGGDQFNADYIKSLFEFATKIQALSPSMERRLTDQELNAAMEVPSLLKGAPARYPWGGSALLGMLGLPGVMVAEEWLTAAIQAWRPDDPSSTEATRAGGGTLSELVEKRPAVVGDPVTRALHGDALPVYAKFLSTRFPPYMYRGFKTRVSKDGYLDALAREQVILGRLNVLLSIDSEESAQRFQSAYEAWNNAQALAGWQAPSETNAQLVAELSPLISPSTDSEQLRYEIEQLQHARQEIYGPLHLMDIRKENGHLLLCPSGIPYAIFGLSAQISLPDNARDALSGLYRQLPSIDQSLWNDAVQQSGLSNLQERNEKAPKNKGWVPFDVSGNVVLLEVEQASVDVESFNDAWNTFKWDNEQGFIFRKGDPKTGLSRQELRRIVGLMDFSVIKADDLRQRPEELPTGERDVHAQLNRFVDNGVAWPYFSLVGVTLNGTPAAPASWHGDHPRSAFQQVIVTKGKTQLFDSGGTSIEITPGQPAFIPATMQGGYMLRADEEASVMLLSVPTIGASSPIAPASAASSPVALAVTNMGWLKGVYVAPAERTEIETLLKAALPARMNVETQSLYYDSSRLSLGRLTDGTPIYVQYTLQRGKVSRVIVYRNETIVAQPTVRIIPAPQQAAVAQAGTEAASSPVEMPPLSAAQFTSEIGYLMQMLNVRDYPRVAQLFRTAIDAVAFVTELARVSGKPAESVLSALDKIEYLAPVAALYRVKTARVIDPSEHRVRSMDIGVRPDGQEYSGVYSQSDIAGQPVSDYLALKRRQAINIPFVFRDEMIEFVERFLGEAQGGTQPANAETPDLETIVERIEAFLGGIDLNKIRYVVTSGIGANEMYSYQLAWDLNRFFAWMQGVYAKGGMNMGVRWIVVNNPAHLSMLPEDATDENTVVFEMSRSGSTKETVDFFNATRDRFQKRIVAANTGKLKESALALAKDALAHVLVIDDTPEDIGGRQMNRKTLMVYAPLFLALASGFKDTTRARDPLAVYARALSEANAHLDYSRGVASQAVNVAEFLFRHRRVGRTKFSVIYDASLAAASKELFQLLNEGANKEVAGNENLNILDSYAFQGDAARYETVAAKAPGTQLAIFLLNPASPDYKAQQEYLSQLGRRGIPYIVIRAELSADGQAITGDLRVLACLSALMQDAVVYYTYLTNQDANSNAAVKVVREVIAVMMEIMKAKNAQGAGNTRMSFSDVEVKLASMRSIEARKAKGAIDQHNAERRDEPELAVIGNSLSALAAAVGIAEQELGAALIQSTSKEALQTDLGEAGQARTAENQEAFARSLMSTGGTLGRLTPRPMAAPLTQQHTVKDTPEMRISVALEAGEEFAVRGTEAEQLADYLYQKYQARKATWRYLALSFMDSDQNDPRIRALAGMMTERFADLGITVPLLALPGVAHNGIEAVMSHPRNIFNVAIIYTNAYAPAVGNRLIEENVTVNNATYVYGFANVTNIAFNGTPSIIFEVPDQQSLAAVSALIEESLGLFRQKIDASSPVAQAGPYKKTQLRGEWRRTAGAPIILQGVRPNQAFLITFVPFKSEETVHHLVRMPAGEGAHIQRSVMSKIGKSTFTQKTGIVSDQLYDIIAEKQADDTLTVTISGRRSLVDHLQVSNAEEVTSSPLTPAEIRLTLKSTLSNVDRERELYQNIRREARKALANYPFTPTNSAVTVPWAMEGYTLTVYTHQAGATEVYVHSKADASLGPVAEFVASVRRPDSADKYDTDDIRLELESTLSNVDQGGELFRTIKAEARKALANYSFTPTRATVTVPWAMEAYTLSAYTHEGGATEVSVHSKATPSVGPVVTFIASVPGAQSSSPVEGASSWAEVTDLGIIARLRTSLARSSAQEAEAEAEQRRVLFGELLGRHEKRLPAGMALTIDVPGGSYTEGQLLNALAPLVAPAKGLRREDADRAERLPAILEALEKLARKRVQLRSDYRYISVSMGGNKLAVSLNDGNNSIIASKELRWDDDSRFSNGQVKLVERAGEVMDTLVGMITDIAQANSVDSARIKTVSLSLAGPIDATLGISGSDFKTPNLPFDKYPLRQALIDRLGRKGVQLTKVEMDNDGGAALKGEKNSPKGKLRGEKSGGIVIIGGGINIKVDDPRFDDEIKECGHNIVGGNRDGQWRYTWVGDKSKGNHPIEVGNTPEEIERKSGRYGSEFVQLGEEAFRVRYPEYPLVQWGKGERDFEDRLSGPNIRARIQQAMQQASPGEEPMYQAIARATADEGRPGELERGLTYEALNGNLVVRQLIKEFAREIGAALGSFLSHYAIGETFAQNLVLVSGINENLGRGVYETADDETAGLDIYMKYIRSEAMRVMTADLLPEYIARTLANGIVRSELTYERELSAYLPADEEIMAASASAPLSTGTERAQASRSVSSPVAVTSLPAMANVPVATSLHRPAGLAIYSDSAVSTADGSIMVIGSVNGVDRIVYFRGQEIKPYKTEEYEPSSYYAARLKFPPNLNTTQNVLHWLRAKKGIPAVDIAVAPFGRDSIYAILKSAKEKGIAALTFIGSGSQVSVSDNPDKRGYFGYNLKTFMADAKDIYNKLGLHQAGLSLVFEVDHFGWSDTFDKTYEKLRLAVGLGWSVLLDFNKLINTGGADLAGKYDPMLKEYARALKRLEQDFTQEHLASIGFEVAFGDIQFQQTSAVEDVAYCLVRLKQLCQKEGVSYARYSLVEKPTGTGHGVSETSDFKLANVADTAKLCYVAGVGFSQHGASGMSGANQERLGEVLVTHIHLFTDMMLAKMFGLLEADPELFIAFVNGVRKVVLERSIENRDVLKNTERKGKDGQRLYPAEIFRPEAFDDLIAQCRNGRMLPKLLDSRPEERIAERTKEPALHLAWFVIEWGRYLAEQMGINQLILNAYQGNQDNAAPVVASIQREFDAWAGRMKLFETAPLLEGMHTDAGAFAIEDIAIDPDADFQRAFSELVNGRLALLDRQIAQVQEAAERSQLEALKDSLLSVEMIRQAAASSPATGSYELDRKYGEIVWATGDAIDLTLPALGENQVFVFNYKTNGQEDEVHLVRQQGEGFEFAPARPVARRFNTTAPWQRVGGGWYTLAPLTSGTRLHIQRGSIRRLVVTVASSPVVENEAEIHWDSLDWVIGDNSAQKQKLSQLNRVSILNALRRALIQEEGNTRKKYPLGPEILIANPVPLGVEVDGNQVYFDWEELPDNAPMYTTFFRGVLFFNGGQGESNTNIAEIILGIKQAKEAPSSPVEATQTSFNMIFHNQNGAGITAVEQLVDAAQRQDSLAASILQNATPEGLIRDAKIGDNGAVAALRTLADYGNKQATLALAQIESRQSSSPVGESADFGLGDEAGAILDSDEIGVTSSAGDEIAIAGSLSGPGTIRKVADGILAFLRSEVNRTYDPDSAVHLYALQDLDGLHGPLTQAITQWLENQQVPIEKRRAFLKAAEESRWEDATIIYEHAGGHLRPAASSSPVVELQPQHADAIRNAIVHYYFRTVKQMNTGGAELSLDADELNMALSDVITGSFEVRAIRYTLPESVGVISVKLDRDQRIFISINEHARDKAASESSGALTGFHVSIDETGAARIEAKARTEFLGQEATYQTLQSFPAVSSPVEDTHQLPADELAGVFNEATRREAVASLNRALAELTLPMGVYELLTHFHPPISEVQLRQAIAWANEENRLFTLVISDAGIVSAELKPRSDRFVSSPLQASDKGGVDGSASSPSMTQDADKGGVDLTNLPIMTQVFAGAPLLKAPQQLLTAVELDAAWVQMQKMIKGGIRPSNERLIEYAYSCCQQQYGSDGIEKVLACIADMLRIEEENATQTDAQLMQLLTQLEAQPV